MAKCTLCEREVEEVSKHHLIPKQKGGKYGPTTDLCQPCHKTIHHTFTNKELAEKYNSIEKLQSAKALQKYLHWIKKRKIERLNF